MHVGASNPRGVSDEADQNKVEPFDDDGTLCPTRRPTLRSLYDVFVNVRNDEREHWKTLCNLVQYDDMQVTGGMVEGTKPAVPLLE